MNRNPWTTEETEFLKAHYGVDGRKFCSDGLGRNAKSVAKKAQAMGLADARWFSEAEKQFVLDNYLTMKHEDIAAIVGKTVSGVERVADKAGLVRKNFYPEDRFCVECGKKLGNKYLHAKRCKSCNNKGERNAMWNGGVSSLYVQIRNVLRSAWVIPVMQRDDYKCCHCGKSGKNLEVHHAARRFVEIRDNVIRDNQSVDSVDLIQKIVDAHRLDDGITLCKACHKKVHLRKPGELLETPNGNAEGNQQPSAGNVRNIVPVKVQRLDGEDVRSDNPSTSARTASLAA